MQKTGWIGIDKTLKRNKTAVCQSCLVPATRQVTYEDLYGKLIINLCDDCSEKDYIELVTQGRFAWPVKGETEV